MDKNLESLEKRVELSKLFDFYGSLLKEGQREIFEDYVFNDYSISEIASAHGLTRQGIFDTIKRCSKALAEYDEKLCLIEKFEKTKEIVGKVNELAKTKDAKNFQRIEELTGTILDIL